MDSKSQLFKGALTTIILQVLNEHGRMYGYEITRLVKEKTDGQLQLTEGALYPALHKLESSGMLTSQTEQVNGRARKYYEITKNGKKEFEIKLEEFSGYFRQMQFLLNLKNVGYGT